ncbi:protein kinase [Nodosilinea sp. LEGE 07088]|uniref:serine/threonine-protein kinase n=1 Tax=Nodosilinea sp. LEGE 07088 TaxID=2777968 RepID=UPI00188003F3|nr:serine/threonine-protein kinase [Nodosilinea sp. LEGE 07088]MBE9135998.1 protein kinase [Nodosilinea sp. LEGE 07088]
MTSPNFQSESKPLGGRYRLIQPLGSGGFGQTFKAQDLHLPGQPLCVIKQLRPQVTTADQMQVARRLFDTEAQTLYKMGAYPQIPRLLAHFEENQEFYLAQEFIEGHSLADELGSPWTEAQVTALVGDLLGTLAFVHSRDVIHRDIKPSNLIRRAGDNRIVLIDFGAVKQASNRAALQRSGLSHTISIGTEGYMPSEQVAGRPQFSSDVYAIGVLGIQALTGYAPTELEVDPRSGELAWRHCAPQTNPQLLEVLDTMVRYDFRTRYANAAEALAALNNLPHQLSQYIPAPNAPPTQPPPATQAAPTVAVGRRYEPTVATSAPAPAPTSAQRRRPPSSSSKPWLPLLAGALVVTAIAGLLGIWVWRSPSTSEPETAVVETSPPDLDATDTEPEAQATPLPDTDEPAVIAPENSAEPADSEPEVTSPPDEPVEENTPNSAPDPSAADGELTPEAAQSTVAALYSNVSNQNWAAARSQFSGPLAQQFDSGFFAQFDRVSVENLRVTGQTADSVEFVGENTYFYPDGSTQREERTFTVQMQDGQPRIVASNFSSVLEAR